MIYLTTLCLIAYAVWRRLQIEMDELFKSMEWNEMAIYKEPKETITYYFL